MENSQLVKLIQKARELLKMVNYVPADQMDNKNLFAMMFKNTDKRTELLVWILKQLELCCVPINEEQLCKILVNSGFLLTKDVTPFLKGTMPRLIQLQKWQLLLKSVHVRENFSHSNVETNNLELEHLQNKLSELKMTKIKYAPAMYGNKKSCNYVQETSISTLENEIDCCRQEIQQLQENMATHGNLELSDNYQHDTQSVNSSNEAWVRVDNVLSQYLSSCPLVSSHEIENITAQISEEFPSIITGADLILEDIKSCANILEAFQIR